MEAILPCPKCHAAEPVAGIVVQGLYDGVLFWECLEDGTRWHRWPEGHYLRERAETWLTLRGVIDEVTGE